MNSSSSHSQIQVDEERLVQQTLLHPYLSPSFKVWVMAFIFFLVFFYLFLRIAFPNTQIVSENFLLSIVLMLVGYLWGQEVRDRERVQTVNQILVESQKKLQDAEINSISSLIRMEEAKDAYVRGHSHRVSQFSIAIAEALHFAPDTKEAIRRAAALHDLGKAVISEEILRKPGKLTDEEWSIVKQHPQSAVDILEPLKFLFLEKRIILHHHERIDGTGYPAGLKDQDIPLESRIIAVADTFDAMNSSRLYREPCSREYILEELKRVAGKQLDARLVSIFLQLLERNPKFWERAE